MGNGTAVNMQRCFISAAASPGRAATAAQLSQGVLLLVPGGQLEFFIGHVHVVLRPFHVGLNVVDEDPLFFHQHENVHEEVMELLHAVLKAQQLLLSGGGTRSQEI